MLPTLSIVGQSKSGKTTLVERLIKELKGRGLRVAAVKHTHQDFEMDKPGKDTWRYNEAGSDAIAISGPNRLALLKPQKENESIDQVLDLLSHGFMLFGIIYLELA